MYEQMTFTEIAFLTLLFLAGFSGIGIVLCCIDWLVERWQDHRLTKLRQQQDSESLPALLRRQAD